MKLKHMLRSIAAALLCSFTLSLTGCAPAATDIGKEMPKEEYPFTVNGVTISEAVDKVAIFDDSLADVVMYLGSAGQLKMAARSSEVTHPEMDVLPAVGTTAAPDVDKMADMGIDLILTDEAFEASVADKLADKKIQVLVCKPAATRAELTELYRAVACTLLGGKTGYITGEKRASSLLMAIDDILRVVPAGEVPVVSGFVLDESCSFATDQTLTGVLLSYVGLTNLAAEETGFTAEELELAAPSVLFCPAGIKEYLKENDIFSKLTAVKKDKVYELSHGELVWQGESLINGLLRIAGFLYPELDTEDLLPEVVVRPDPDDPSSGSDPSDDPSDDPSSSRPNDNPSSDRPSSDVPSNPSTSTPSQDYPESVDASSSSADIRILQNRLIELGYLPPPSDGQYSYWTRACVKQFQGKVGLPETGIADKATMKALFAADAPRF